MKYYELLKNGEERLKNAGITEAATDAWILFEDVFGMNRSDFLIKKSEEVPEECYQYQCVIRFQNYIEERCLHRPVQYITGKWSFMGLEFMVNEKVLIPRFDTECLVEQALCILKKIQDAREKESSVNVLDMCTGSGCIAISIQKLYKKQSSNDIYVEAVDLSGEALAVARENAKKHNAEITFVESDLFSGVQDGKRFDIIVSNPPYIRSGEIDALMPEVRSFEPRMALDGDSDGLRFYRKIIDEGRSYIRRGGYLLFEIGYDQGMEVRNLFLESGYSEIEIIPDLAGLDRVAVARYQ